jgi:hypothetical protein
MDSAPRGASTELLKSGPNKLQSEPASISLAGFFCLHLRIGIALAQYHSNYGKGRNSIRNGTSVCTCRTGKLQSETLN